MKQVYFLLSILYMQAMTLPASAYSDHRNRKVDSLENVLRKAPPKDKVDCLRIYNDLAWGYLEINEQKSTYYADCGIALAQEVKDYRKLADLYRIKGMHHWGNSRYGQAKACFDKSLDVLGLMRKSGKYDERTIDDTESSIYGSMGNLYNTWGNDAKAIYYYLQALKLFRKHGWKESESIAYSCIAELYYGMGNLKRAETYLAKGIAAAKTTGDSLMLCNNYRGMAKIHMQHKQYEKAERLIDFVYRYTFSHPDEEGSSRGDCLLCMADIYLAKGDLKKAEQVIDLHETMNRDMHRSEASFECQKAQLAMLKGDWTKVCEQAKRALEEDGQAPEIGVAAAWLLAKAYAHMGEPAKAVSMMDKADSLRTRQANHAYQTSLAEQEVRFDSERKDIKIEQLVNARATYLMLFLAATLLVVLLIALFFYRRKANKRQKELLTARIIMETEVKERQMLAKDLHDGLGGMLSLLKLKIREQVTGEPLRILDKSIADLRRISHHMMPEELITHGLEVSLRDFAASVPGAQFHFFGERNHLQQDVELVLYRCAYELVNNVMKHAAAARIDIQLIQQSGSIILTVSDNGKGFDVSQETKGMGLQNIRARIARYQGRMEIISHMGEGTEINVTIPL